MGGFGLLFKGWFAWTNELVWFGFGKMVVYVISWCSFFYCYHSVTLKGEDVTWYGDCGGIGFHLPVVNSCTYIMGKIALVELKFQLAFLDKKTNI